MDIKKLNIYDVGAYEKNSTAGWLSARVAADSINEARRIGVDVLELKGVLESRKILRTEVIDTGVSIWVNV